jgi:Pretoxin HINT domain
MASALPSQKSLLRDRRGASTYIQALILVSLVALGGLAAFKALGSTTSNSADCVGKRVGALAPVECRNTGGEQLPASVAEPPAAPEPDQSDSQPGAEEIDPLEELKKLALDILGVTDAVDCFTKGDIMACVMTALQLSPIKAIGVGIKLAKNAKRIKELVDRVLAARKAKKGDEVADAGGKCKGNNCRKPDACFAAGTVVHTDRGAVPIEELAAGDLVLSRDDQTGEEAFRPIAQMFVTPDQPLLALALEDSLGAVETFDVTAPHPFYVEDRGWVSAGDLRAGDEVVSSGGGRLHVASNVATGRRTTVYNFEVEDFNTYFVGEAAAWVHNQDKDKGCGPAASDITWKGFPKGSLKSHYEKHGHEFGDITQQEYLKRAKDFAAETGTKFKEQKVGNIIVKYDPATGRVLIGHAGSREIRTFYKTDSPKAFEEAVEKAREITGG